MIFALCANPLKSWFPLAFGAHHMTTATTSATSANTAPAVELEGKDLPAHCPNPAMPLWSSHPRVFLDFHHGEAKCPYCGTAYRLKPGTVVGHH
jgi:uncharacterized Zn-finger protein